MGYFIDLTNRRFGKLTVIEAIPNPPHPREIQMPLKWKCKCDCGTETIVRGDSMRRGHTTSCGCARYEFIPPNRNPDRRIAILKNHYNSSFQRSFRTGSRRKRFGKNFINFETYCSIIENSCTYCGCPPSTKLIDVIPSAKKTGKLSSDTVVMVHGIDRIDSSLGYITGNVTACCSRCNYAKHTMTTAEFLAWIAQVFKHTAIQLHLLEKTTASR